MDSKRQAPRQRPVPCAKDPDDPSMSIRSQG
jgi:hypothetical protein